MHPDLGALGRGAIYVSLSLIGSGIALLSFVDHDKTVTAAGMVRPSGDVVRVPVAVSGRIAEIATSVGSVVAVGEELAKIEGQDYENAVSREDARLAGARRASGVAQKLVSLIEGEGAARLASREVELGLARAERDRMLSLVAAGIESHQSLRRRDALVEAAEAELNSDRESMKVRLEEARLRLVETQAATREAQLRLHAARDTAGRTIVRSPVTGTLVWLAVRARDEWLDAGSTVAHVAPQGGLSFVARVRGGQLQGVEVGSTARVELDGHSKLRFGFFEGRVESISADAGEAGEYEVVVGLAPGSVAQGGVRLGLGGVAHLSAGRRPLWEMFFG